jgi:hypothetical protein
MGDRAMVGEGASGDVAIAAGIDISGPLGVAAIGVRIPSGSGRAQN